MNSLKHRIGYRLLHARLHVGMSQEKLADAVGCHASQISRWERGHLAPSIDHLAAIALATGISLDWLIIDAAPMIRQAGWK